MAGVVHVDTVDVASINGNFNGGEDFYMHISIPAYAVALEHKDVLAADIKAFIEQMLETIVDLKD
jgi:hypothetical protein